MSERSFRREHQRRVAATRRREANRARRVTAAAVAAGAFALVAPAASSAANFVVNTTAAGGTTCDPNDTTVDCSLPDAVSQANSNTEADTITFASSLSGQTITLNTPPYGGPIAVNEQNGNPLTITGPGAENLTVDGNGSSYVFDVQSTGGETGLTISGLTITNGSGQGAGAIRTARGTRFNLEQSVVSGSTATGASDINGPIIYYAAAGGGLTNSGTTHISGSVFTGNHSETSPYGPYGGGAIDNLGKLTIDGSTITQNEAFGAGGGVFNGVTKYPTALTITDSLISDNAAPYGAGVGGFDPPFAGTKYGSSHNTIENTTITGNTALGDPGRTSGAGIGLKYVGGADNWTISHTTITGQKTAAYGGGLSLGRVGGHVTLIDSTISGNESTYVGGGAFVSGYAQKYPSAVQFQNSTIASNDTGYAGGGIYLGGSDEVGPNGPKYPVHQTMGSTIVADNTAGGDPNDLDEVDQSGGDFFPGGGFDMSFSLVEHPGTAVITGMPPESNIFGVDPQLGDLADNGGPTPTQLPAITSPVIDKGNAPSGLTTDQRGDPRTAGGGTDIGAVELPAGPPGPPPPSGGGGTKVGTLKKKHKKRRRVIRTKNKVAKVRLTFRTSNTGVTFQCSVDGGAFSPCKSPFVAKLASAPGKGKKHKIAIKQVDAAGNQVGNVRVFKFRVVLKD